MSINFDQPTILMFDLSRFIYKDSKAMLRLRKVNTLTVNIRNYRRHLLLLARICLGQNLCLRGKHPYMDLYIINHLLFTVQEPDLQGIVFVLEIHHFKRSNILTNINLVQQNIPIKQVGLLTGNPSRLVTFEPLLILIKHLTIIMNIKI